jgi:hypothetical protein
MKYFLVLLLLTGCSETHDNVYSTTTPSTLTPTPNPKDMDGDGMTIPLGDCDDTDSSIYYMAPERCDGKDNDCDREIDEGFNPQVWFVDKDRDGYGTGLEVITQGFDCRPSGYSLLDNDCNDDDVMINVNVLEKCDGIDNNCDLLIDSGYVDVDGDSYFLSQHTDFGQMMPIISSNCHVNMYGMMSTIKMSGDCDDSAIKIHPNAVEVCDQVDNDCDGFVDGYYPLRDYDKDEFCVQNPQENVCQSVYNSVSYSYCTSYDADYNYLKENYEMPECDTDYEINPGVLEVCDSIDNDCNLIIDDPTYKFYYPDMDQDGYGTSIDETVVFYLDCNGGYHGELLSGPEIPENYTHLTGDCDDYFPGKNPIDGWYCSYDF